MKDLKFGSKGQGGRRQPTSETQKKKAGKQKIYLLRRGDLKEMWNSASGGARKHESLIGGNTRGSRVLLREVAGRTIEISKEGGARGGHSGAQSVPEEEGLGYIDTGSRPF